VHLLSAACGLVKNPIGGPEVVIASDESSYIFSLDDQQWRNGPLLPKNMKWMMNAQLEDDFLVIGGYENGKNLNSVYRFDKDLYDWVLLDAVMQIPRRFAAAVPVPDSFLSCQLM